MSKDPFGFSGAAAELAAIKDEQPGPATPPLMNIDDFAPEPKKPNLALAAAAAQVSEEAGFHRTARERRPGRSTDAATMREEAPAAAPRQKLQRVRLSELRKDRDSRDLEARAQLNIIAPISLVEEWKEQMTAYGEETQWRLLARAVELLKAERSK